MRWSWRGRIRECASGSAGLASRQFQSAEARVLFNGSNVVTNAGTDSPELTRIRNPAARFREGEDIFATGFMVHEEDWRRHGE